MKKHICKFEDSISEIIHQYATSITPEILDQEASRRLYKQYGPTAYLHLDEEERERAKRQLRETIRSENFERTIDGINNSKGLLRQAYETEKTTTERKRLLARTGQTILNKWAKENGITPDQAKAELDQYAAVKKGGYADTLSDRYAAIVNRDNLSGQDRLFSDIFLDDEYADLGIKGNNDDLKRAEYYMNKPTGITLNEWNTSGGIIERQLYRKNNSEE